MLFRWLLFSTAAMLPVVYAQSAVLTCAPSAVPPMVRAEGLAERTGDIVLSCSGGQPAGQVSGNIILSLNVNVTNRVLADGASDVTLTVDNGSGTPTTFTARPFSANAVAFNGVVFNASAQGKAEMRIVNLRGNASQLGFAPNQLIAASFSFTGQGLALLSSSFVVAVPQRALLATTTGHLICTYAGSPVPDTPTFSSLLAAGSVFSTTRVTEGFATAFAPLPDPSNLRADSGVRVIERYSGFPGATHLFVPDVIAGSDADVPTAAGDAGFAPSGGQYTPGRSQLLLIRVAGADANGAGGSLVAPVPTAQTSFNSVSEVGLNGGSGYVVYEVVDANPFLRESAQIPTFLGLAANAVSSTVDTNSSVNLAPVSTVFTQSTNAPIPRFIESAPPSDCTDLGDCSAGYFPILTVSTAPLAFSVPAGQSATQYVPIRNNGAGVLQWSATAAYASGSNWLRLSPSQAVNNSTLRVDALTTGLQAGTYQATITIDAGPTAGTRTIPVALTVTGSGSSAAPAPAIASVYNAAGPDQTTLVAGSLATIMGNNFAGRALQVTFDGTPATVLYSDSKQINLQVPAALQGKQTASMVVSVDGNGGTPMTVKLASAAPAIFPGAVLNQDSGVNSASAPAVTGQVVQIFATGLPASGVITARIHDRAVPVPQYGGAAPALPGVQQVNILVPDDLPTMQTYVFVCGGPSADQQVCSAPAKIWLMHQ